MPLNPQLAVEGAVLDGFGRGEAGVGNGVVWRMERAARLAIDYWLEDCALAEVGSMRWFCFSLN